MIRGTTPTFILTINDDSIDLTEMDNVYATFKQNGVLITKSGDDIEVEANEVDVYLSQEDSLKFSEGYVSVQLNWTFDDGKRACSNIVNVQVKRNLVGEVLE